MVSNQHYIHRCRKKGWYVSLTPFFSVSFSIAIFSLPLTQPYKCTAGRGREGGGWNSLGLGDEKSVAEEEEMSLLGLQASLQLGLGVTQEEAAGTLGQEGLDQGTRLRADRDQAALPVGQDEGGGGRHWAQMHWICNILFPFIPHPSLKTFSSNNKKCVYTRVLELINIFPLIILQRNYLALIETVYFYFFT